MRLAIAAAATLAATTAHAQTGGPQCGPTEIAVRTLTEQFKEAPIAFGQASNGLWMVFATADGSTWTLLLVRGPIACVVADGQDWQAQPAASPLTPGRGA